jgi:hypothetical protein
VCRYLAEEGLGPQQPLLVPMRVDVPRPVVRDEDVDRLTHLRKLEHLGRM